MTKDIKNSESNFGLSRFPVSPTKVAHALNRICPVAIRRTLISARVVGLGIISFVTMRSVLVLYLMHRYRACDREAFAA